MVSHISDLITNFHLNYEPQVALILLESFPCLNLHKIDYISVDSLPDTWRLIFKFDQGAAFFLINAAQDDMSTIFDKIEDVVIDFARNLEETL